jgi:WD40 repeat protein
VRLWDADNGQQLAILTNHTEEVHSVSWSPKGRRFASASFDETMRLWDAESLQPIATFSSHVGFGWMALASFLGYVPANQASYMWAVAWSPDGRRLASASSDEAVSIWDAASGKSLATLTRPYLLGAHSGLTA